MHPLHPPPRSAHTTLPNLFNSKMVATNSENPEYSLAKAIQVGNGLGVWGLEGKREGETNWAQLLHVFLPISSLDSISATPGTSCNTILHTQPNYWAIIQVSGKLSTYPSPNSTLTLTYHLGQNVGLGKGQVSNEGAMPPEVPFFQRGS